MRTLPSFSGLPVRREIGPSPVSAFRSAGLLSATVRDFGPAASARFDEMPPPSWTANTSGFFFTMYGANIGRNSK